MTISATTPCADLQGSPLGAEVLPRELPWHVNGSVPDLAFAEHWRPYATHALHPFAAKFPPPLAAWAIEQFSAPGECVLDPFAGSGTTLVEARLRGRHSLGVEIDPLARLIARVKATPLAMKCIEAAWEAIEAQWESVRAEPVEVPTFRNRDHWFRPEIQQDLVRLTRVLASVEDVQVREFFLVVFSSVIIAKGLSTVANALDIAHSRAHHVARDDVPDVWMRFRDRYRRALRGMKDFAERARCDVRADLRGEDARALPLKARSVAAIVTSPPYVTAIEYPRSHKFSVWWIGDLLGVPHTVYEQLHPRYIGSESRPHGWARPFERFDLPCTDAVLAALVDADPEREDHVRRYFVEMRSALTEMLRVLQPGRHAVLVVGGSVLRGIEVPTPRCLVEIAESIRADGARFLHCETLSRPIRERSRQMPIKRGQNGHGMKQEEVVILQRADGE